MLPLEGIYDALMRLLLPRGGVVRQVGGMECAEPRWCRTGVVIYLDASVVGRHLRLSRPQQLVPSLPHTP